MTIPKGVRFSLNYGSRSEPMEDSERMRRRIYRLFTVGEFDDVVTADLIELGVGVAVPRWPSGSAKWEVFFQSCALKDFLDVITVVARGAKGRSQAKLQSWVGAVGTIFQEENVRYRVDDLGGVHFAIDGEFVHNQACAIAALQAPKYGAARAHFEAGQRALDQTPPQTREAIRQTFECVETVFKLMFPVAQLGVTEVTKKLKPLLQERLRGTEREVALRLAENFIQWIIGAHPYRHGQAVEEPDNPGLSTAILSVSLGSTYARWLAELDTGL